ncbi:MAG TPA: hypothetical protein PK806_03685, partial [Saprospiraceae bacterium]|nr:hypothetical protein [Saprospiraceae bacterium]
MQKFLLWVALLLCNIVILNATTSTGANTKHHNDYVRPVVIKNVHSGMKKLFNYRTNTGNANFGRYTAKSSVKAGNAIISNTYGSGNSWAFAKKDIKYNMMSIDSLGLTEITCHDNGTKHTT